MSGWTEADRRVGLWSATGAAAIGVVFVVVGLAGVVARPPGPDPLRQVDPYLAILEILMMLFAVALITMMAALHAYAAPDRKTFALASLAFVLIFSLLTCSVHFARLTVWRQSNPGVWPWLRNVSFLPYCASAW